MDSFELNKIVGGVLASVLLVLLVNTLGASVFEDKKLEQNAYIVEGVESSGDATGGPVKDKGPSLAVLMASATPADGERVFRKCATCHTLEKGGAHRTGPNLYGTLGHTIASHSGYSYSNAFQNHGGSWDFETLATYLENPRTAIPGNKMSFAGLKRPEELAAILVLLNQNTDSPLPLPTPEPEPAAEAVEDAAPAETGAASADEAA